MDIQQEQLIIKKSKLEPKAFGPIFEAYVKDVYRYVYSLTKDRNKTEDMVSDCFIKAIKNIKSYEFTGKSIKHWLFVIARNGVYGQKTVTQVQLDENQDTVIEDESILNQLITQESVGEIELLLSKLSIDQQEVIKLKIWEEFTFEAISNLTNKSVSACKMLYYRGLNKLKGSLV